MPNSIKLSEEPEMIFGHLRAQVDIAEGNLIVQRFFYFLIKSYQLHWIIIHIYQDVPINYEIELNGLLRILMS